MKRILFLIAIIGLATCAYAQGTVNTVPTATDLNHTQKPDGNTVKSVVKPVTPQVEVDLSQTQPGSSKTTTPAPRLVNADATQYDINQVQPQSNTNRVVPGKAKKSTQKVDAEITTVPTNK